MRSSAERPTIQGEGALAGLPTLFVRVGLCDYRCEWCDSMFAVEPEQVKKNADKLSAEQIHERLKALSHTRGMWVTLSGGNPAVHDLTDLVKRLRGDGYNVAVETQGSVWRPWLASVDHLTVSPKPPSSGMVSDKHRKQTVKFMWEAFKSVPITRRSIKIVIFDDEDYDWAKDFVSRNREWMTFLSVGTDPIGRWGTEVVSKIGVDPTVRGISERYAWLCDKVANEPLFVGARVLPQLHVIAYGHARGV